MRRRLLENEPISNLRDARLQPTVFYRWQKEFFEQGDGAFEQRARPHHSADKHNDRVSGEENPDTGEDSDRVDGGARHTQKDIGAL